MCGDDREPFLQAMHAPLGLLGVPRRNVGSRELALRILGVAPQCANGSACGDDHRTVTFQWDVEDGRFIAILVASSEKGRAGYATRRTFVQIYTSAPGPHAG